MNIPLELAFHNMAPSDALALAVRRQVAKLDRFYDHIIGCRVVIEMPHKSHRLRSNTPDVHVVLRVPGREIIVSRELAHLGKGKASTNAYAVVADAFTAAGKRLRDYRSLKRGEVKSKHGADAARAVNL